MYQGISWSALHDFQHLKRDYHFYTFSKIGRHPLWESYQNIKSFNSYAVVSDDPGKSGNRQPGCSKLPPSSCYFKPQPMSVGVSLLPVLPGKKCPMTPLSAEWQCWSCSISSRLPIWLKRDLLILSSADGIKRTLCHSPLDYTDASKSMALSEKGHCNRPCKALTEF